MPETSNLLSKNYVKYLKFLFGSRVVDKAPGQSSASENKLGGKEILRTNTERNNSKAFK